MAGQEMGMVLSVLLLPFCLCKAIDAIFCIVLTHVRSQFDCCRIMKRIKRTVKRDVPPGENNNGI